VTLWKHAAGFLTSPDIRQVRLHVQLSASPGVLSSFTGSVHLNQHCSSRCTSKPHFHSAVSEPSKTWRFEDPGRGEPATGKGAVLESGATFGALPWQQHAMCSIPGPHQLAHSAASWGLWTTWRGQVKLVVGNGPACTCACTVQARPLPRAPSAGH